VIDRKQFDARREALEKQLHEKLGLRGKSLQSRLRRAGRLLPKRLRLEGQYLVEAERKMSHPRLATQVDEARAHKAFDALETHLKTIDAADRRRSRVIHWLAGLVFNLLILGALALIALRWQGII
jgi:formamidopyrimidine-DNA glycosylase